jgi:hypothetical protein
MTVYLCNFTDGEQPERCVRNFGHAGSHVYADGENLPEVERPTGIIHHQASEGLPWLTITHRPHACAWCDAERYRQEHPEE